MGKTIPYNITFSPAEGEGSKISVRGICEGFGFKAHLHRENETINVLFDDEQAIDTQKKCTYRRAIKRRAEAAFM